MNNIAMNIVYAFHLIGEMTFGQHLYPVKSNGDFLTGIEFGKAVLR
jgi:hypothetical protein